MRLIKLILPLIFVSVICISFFSCSENNPVIPSTDTTYNYDSARYDWTVERLFISPDADIYVPDTNNFYTLTDGYLLWEHEAKIDYIPLPNSCSGLGGLDNNNIYLPGFQVYSGADRNVIRILKFNGSTFTDLMFPTDTVASENILNYVSPYSENEVWFASGYSSKIYKYDGASFHLYNLDSGYKPSVGFVKNNSGVFIHALNYTGQFPDTSRIYKYDGTKFIPVYSVRAYTPYPTNFQMSVMNNNYYSPRYDGLYRFTGSDFVKIISPPVHFSGKVGGRNETDFLIEDYSGNYSDPKYFLNWNGSKWSKEIPRLPFSSSSNIYKINNNYYFSFFDGYNYLIYTGRLKK